MSDLKQTIKVKNGHVHVVYLRDDGSGETSVEKKHSHLVQFGVIQPAPDGHTHEITDYVPKQAETPRKEEDIVNDVVNLYKQAKQDEKDSRDKGLEAEKIYSNEKKAHWPKTPKGENRTSAVINMVKKNIDGLSGYQRQHRTEFRFFPTENGDQKVADMLNIVVKNITEQCYYGREETKVFEDQTIAGRGLFNTYLDRSKSILGDIIVEKYPWDGCYFGPHEKEDLSDCDYLVKHKWMSEVKVRELYPDKMDKLFPEEHEDEQTQPHNADRVVAYQQQTPKPQDPDLVDAVKKQYKELECIRREYKRVYILVNAVDDFIFNADGWAKGDIDAVSTIPGFSSIPRVVSKIRVQKVMSNTLLDDFYPDDGLDDYPITPVYATKRRDAWWGKIEESKDVQRAINKAWSQFMDIINKVVAYGYYIDANTFEKVEEREKFKNNASSPGFVVEVTDVEKPPKQVEGIKFPVELAEFIKMLNNTLKEIMSINLELLGMDQTGNQSGIAIKQKIAQQLLGNDFIFDNLSFAKKIVGKNILKLIQKNFSADRILRIINNQNNKEPVEIGGQELDAYTPDEVLQWLQNTDLANYDVVVSESSDSPSAQISNFIALLELASKGIQIPPQAIIDFAPIPNKEKIKKMMEEAAAMQQQEMQMKYGTEIEKAKIAQQGKLAGQSPAGIPA